MPPFSRRNLCHIYRFLTGLIFSLLSYICRSILPGVILHFVALFLFFVYVWPHDTERKVDADSQDSRYAPAFTPELPPRKLTHGIAKQRNHCVPWHRPVASAYRSLADHNNAIEGESRLRALPGNVSSEVVRDCFSRTSHDGGGLENSIRDIMSPSLRIGFEPFNKM
jgi:hypothetical protein